MGYLGRTPTPSPIDSSDIPDDSIDASKIIDGAIAVADVADNAITEAKIADAAVVSLKSGRKNLIINGAMKVAQRGTSFTNVANNALLLDRWKFKKDNTDQLVAGITQDSNAPSGFQSSLKYTTSTVETALAADEQVALMQYFEGQDISGFAYGTADAKTITASFWVKSTLVGVYGVWAYVADTNKDTGSTYTINVANTWEYKTITFPANTAGTCNYDNTLGFLLSFTLDAGTDLKTTNNTTWASSATGRKAYGHTASLITTSSSTWQIAGVQLELGSVATDFEHRSYGEELALCQRYYEQSPSLAGFSGAKELLAISTGALGGFHFLQTKRAAPSISVYSRSGAVGKVSDMATGGTSASVGINTIGTTAFHYAGGSGFVVGHLYEANYTADAEL